MALYHKYRPQTFDDVIAQTHIVQTLSNQIKTDKVSHAYLFSGPRGVGKTTTARILAKSLNCTVKKAGEIEPCNECQSCEEIRRRQCQTKYHRKFTVQTYSLQIQNFHHR